MKSLRSALLLIVIWELFVYFGQIPEFLLPAPHHIATRLWLELHEPYMHQHVIITTLVSLHGLLFGAIIGITTGWLFYHATSIRHQFSWLVMGSQAVPVIALAPLFLIWIPETYWARVAVATIITFFPIYSATFTALERIPIELREVSRLYGASRWQLIIYLEVIQAAPVIISGMRTSMALATTGAVVGEFLGGRDGLGALINIARGLFDTTLVFVAITILVFITLIFHICVSKIGHRIQKIADGTQ